MWISELFVIISVLAIVCVTYLLSILCTYTIRYWKQKGAYADIPRLGTESMPMLTLFQPNGVKQLLHDSVTPEGKLKAPALFVGPHLDGTATNFICDAEHFQLMLTEEKFPKLQLMYQTFEPLLGNGLVMSTGAAWKQQRANLNPLFHFSKLKQMPEIMNQRVVMMCDELEKLNGAPVKPTAVFGKMTLSVVIDCIFGGERYLSAEQLSPLWEKANIATNSYIPSVIFLGKSLNDSLPLPYNRTLFSTMKEIRRMVKNAIDIKKQEMADDPSSEDTDLLGSLLRIRDEQTGQPISDELIIDEALTFLFAGHDTTSALLSWCMTFIAERPDVVEKLREEIEQVLGGGDVAEFDQIQHLSYCDQVLRETLRMRPPVPTLDRQVGEDVKLGDHTFLQGSYIYPLFIAAHFDQRYWKEPFSFRPERFSKERKNEEPAQHHFAWLPFSGGARNCIGKRFAMIEAVLALTTLISRFDVTSSMKEDEAIWSFEGTMKPVNYTCSFRRRTPQ